MQNIKAYVMLVCATLFWSGNFIVGKAASFYDIPPFSLNFYRWLFAFLILFPFTFKEVFSNKDYIFQNLGLFFILGITSITIFNSIVYYSLYYTQVISGILMISTIPVWILFFASILKIEQTNIFQISGVILSLTGVLFIITKADINLIKELEFNKGDLSMVIGMLSWAIYSALLRKKNHPISQIALLEIIIICGFIFLVPIYFIEMSFGNKIVLGLPFIDFLAPGLISMQVIQQAFSHSSSSILMGKVMGNIIDLIGSPLSAAEVTLAIVLASVTIRKPVHIASMNNIAHCTNKTSAQRINEKS